MRPTVPTASLRGTANCIGRRHAHAIAGLEPVTVTAVHSEFVALRERVRALKPELRISHGASNPLEGSIDRGAVRVQQRDDCGRTPSRSGVRDAGLPYGKDSDAA